MQIIRDARFCSLFCMAERQASNEAGRVIVRGGRRTTLVRHD